MMIWIMYVMLKWKDKEKIKINVSFWGNYFIVRFLDRLFHFQRVVSNEFRRIHYDLLCFLCQIYKINHYFIEKTANKIVWLVE